MRKNQPSDVFKYINMSGGPDACWPFTGVLNSKQLPYFKVKGKTVLAYRLVYRLTNGDDALTDDQVLRHKCDNPVCCNPSHHVPGTQQQNMDDMKERERHGLPSVVVKAIRRLSADGRAHSTIAELYGIAKGSVDDIVSGRTHKGGS